MTSIAAAALNVDISAKLLSIISSTQEVCNDTDLGPILTKARSLLVRAVSTLDAAIGVPAACHSPEYDSETPSGVFKLPPSRSADPDVSSWDPADIGDAIEVSRCRALLLEIIRRAAHDWVLYRQHDRLQYKQIAEGAYIWLFEEDYEHPWAQIRKDDEKELMGFLAICDILDLDPEMVRARVRRMTIKDIMGAGRPPERRQVYNGGDATDDVHYAEHDLSVDFEVSTYGDNSNMNSYENAFAAYTPSYG